MSTLQDLSDAIRGPATAQDADDVLALLLLRDPTKLQGEGRALLAGFAARAAIGPSLSAAALEAAVQLYLETHPLDAGVVARLKTVAEGLVMRGGPTSSDVAAALTVLGQEPAKGPLGGGSRPKGTIPAGPFARFHVDKKEP